MSRYDKWPLHTAATARDLNAAQAALRGGCKVDQPNETGLTPLMCAALVNCRPMTEELLANGADVRRVLQRAPCVRTAARNADASPLSRGRTQPG
jgi:ankyrin repeat protein